MEEIVLTGRASLLTRTAPRPPSGNVYSPVGGAAPAAPGVTPSGSTEPAAPVSLRPSGCGRCGSRSPCGLSKVVLPGTAGATWATGAGHSFGVPPLGSAWCKAAGGVGG